MRATTAPGKLPDVNGLKPHLLCKGSGAPVVVFETGSANPSSTCFEVENQVADQGLHLRSTWPQMEPAVVNPAHDGSASSRSSHAVESAGISGPT